MFFLIANAGAYEYAKYLTAMSGTFPGLLESHVTILS